MEDPTTVEPLKKRVDFGWIRESYDLYKNDAAIWICATFLRFAVCGGLNSIVSAMLHERSLLEYIVALLHAFAHLHHGPHVHVAPAPRSHFKSAVDILVGLIVASTVDPGFFTMSNKAVGRIRIKPADLIPDPQSVVQFFIVGSCLLGVPELVNSWFYSRGPVNAIFALYVLLSAPLMYLTYAVLADEKNIRRSFYLAWFVFKLNWFRAALLYLVYIILLVGGSCFCIVSSFVTVPMAFIMTSLAYRDLIGMSSVVLSDDGDQVSNSWPPPPRMN